LFYFYWLFADSSLFLVSISSTPFTTSHMPVANRRRRLDVRLHTASVGAGCASGLLIIESAICCNEKTISES
jgi:hypothetical protein